MLIDLGCSQLLLQVFYNHQLLCGRMKRSDRKKETSPPPQIKELLCGRAAFACLTGLLGQGGPHLQPRLRASRRQSRFKFVPGLAPGPEAARACLYSPASQPLRLGGLERSFGCWATRPLAVLPRGNEVSTCGGASCTPVPP